MISLLLILNFSTIYNMWYRLLWNDLMGSLVCKMLHKIFKSPCLPLNAWLFCTNGWNACRCFMCSCIKEVRVFQDKQGHGLQYERHKKSPLSVLLYWIVVMKCSVDLRALSASNPRGHPLFLSSLYTSPLLFHSLPLPLCGFSSSGISSL